VINERGEFMEDWYANEAEALISEFDLPRVEEDPIMAEIRRWGLKVEPSQRIDYPAGHDQAIRLYTQDGEEVGYAVSEHVRLSLIHALRQVLERER
jgi:hypothetical protein